MNIALFVILLAIPPKKAFTQEVSTNPAGCGEPTITVGSKIQEFKIPNTGKPGFDQPTKCTYKLTSEKDTNIVFNITGLDIGNGGNCMNNYIKVADTPDGIKDSKYYTCGNKLLPSPFKSTSNMAYMEFEVTDKFGQSFVSGTLIAVPRINPACGPVNLTLNTASAVLKIPSEGNKFTTPTLCFYHIEGNDDKNLSLEITHLMLGNDGQCKEDFIKVAGSPDKLETTNYSYCGSKLPADKFFSDTKHLYIVVSTFTHYDKTSISATYSKVNFVSKLQSSSMVVTLMLSFVAMC